MIVSSSNFRCMGYGELPSPSTIILCSYNFKFCVAHHDAKKNMFFLFFETLDVDYSFKLSSEMLTICILPPHQVAHLHLLLPHQKVLVCS